MSNSIQQLKDQEVFHLYCTTVPNQPEISVNAPFVYEHGQLSDLNHLKLSEPFKSTIKLVFTDSDEHYGTHLVNLTTRTFDYRCQHTGRKMTDHVIEKFESHTLDTSKLHPDLQSNFMYIVASEYTFHHLNLAD